MFYFFYRAEGSSFPLVVDSQFSSFPLLVDFLSSSFLLFLSTHAALARAFFRVRHSKGRRKKNLEGRCSVSSHPSAACPATGDDVGAELAAAIGGGCSGHSNVDGADDEGIIRGGGCSLERVSSHRGQIVILINL